MTREERKRFIELLDEARDDVVGGELNPFWLGISAARTKKPISMADFLARKITENTYSGDERRSGERRAKKTR